EGGWELLFTPDKVEGQGAAEEEAAATLKKLLAEEKKGLVCRVKVPERSLKALVSGITPFSILDEYCKTQPGRYLSVAERIVYEGTEELAKHVPLCRYGKLISADKEEIENYHTIRTLFEDYIYQFDHLEGDERLQPLSVAVFGAPGCGKSFGVRQIAGSMGRFAVTSLNLSQYHAPTEFFEGLREGLQCKNNQIPLIFIDEFDADLAGTPRGWLRYFLAPMQDGEFTLNGKRSEVNAAVFVFAGATASSFERFLPSTPEERDEFRLVKGSDFVSRLKGILNVKGPNTNRPTDRSAVIRRAMLLRSEITRRFPNIYDEASGTVNMSRSLLAAMLTVSEYRHGTRSMELILAMSCLSGVERFTPACLPMAEQLNLHVNAEDFRKRLAFEQIMGAEVEKFAQIAHEHVRQRSPEDSTDPALAPWEELDEAYKESYRSRLRYLGEQFQGYDMNIGLRPLLPETDDAIDELYGPTLELLSELEHRRWMRDKERDGWRLGKFDRDLRLTPDLVPYADLSEETRELIRKSLRSFPQYLRELGYELYVKAY
ncbi:MAG: RyR domain-containing protein, partial [bacterium]